MTIKTNVDGVFCDGKCNSKVEFMPTDFQIVDYIMGIKKEKLVTGITTYGLFIDPPLGRVGMKQNLKRRSKVEVLVATCQ
jgi:hypothetical protein